jgi:hypothetical protein
VKVGDLVQVGRNKLNGAEGFVSIITAICLPEDQVNQMHLIQVLGNVGAVWYPVGYIEVINEAR